MGTPLVRPGRFVVPALLVCLSSSAIAVASQGPSTPQSPVAVNQVAVAATGHIVGSVLDDRGQPLDGVIVSALGGSTGFALTGKDGRFTLRSLTPGPYLLRAHLQGYLPARNSMVSVRPLSRTEASFTLRREGRASEPRVMTAGVGVTEISAAPSDKVDRDESETAWRLRHLKRPILKDANGLLAVADDDEWFITDSLELVGRAMESSARLAGAFILDLPLQGQVNLLTTGAFDTPNQLLQLDRTRAVTYFVVGAPVGGHGDWNVKAALNQGDLSSWIVTGNYVARAAARHRYQFGMSYGVHRYEGGNAVALAAVPESARNVGAVYAHDEWVLSPALTIGFGGNYAHYDYLGEPAHLSPRLSATINATDHTRIRALAMRQVTAPGAEEFIPPSRAAVLPPQRTFAPLTRDGFIPEDVRHYELGFEQRVSAATIGVRAFQQRVDDQLVTVFGLRNGETPASELGHYFVASVGDVALRGVGISYTQTLASFIRGSIEYSLADAEWSHTGRLADRSRLARHVPSAVRPDRERIHDLTTSIETEVPMTATRVFFVVKMNSGFVRSAADDASPALEGRFDFQVSQSLPFMNFLRAEWEMLVGVRNLFRESLVESSFYDELLVARPPKRLIGGLTVKF